MIENGEKEWDGLLEYRGDAGKRLDGRRSRLVDGQARNLAVLWSQ